VGLDFQDALRPTHWDLAHLLQDARRDVSPGDEVLMLNRYLAARPGVDREAFLADYRALALQRCAHLGRVFARQALLGRTTYDLHARTGVTRTHLTDPPSPGLKAWFDRHVPAARRDAGSQKGRDGDGAGRRSAPYAALTDEIPKAVPVAPDLLDRVLDKLVEAAWNGRCQCHHFADQVEAHLKAPGLEISISDDSGCGLRRGIRSRAVLGEDPIFLANIDSLWLEARRRRWRR